MARMFRNTAPVVSDQGAEIEEGCLWVYDAPFKTEKGSKLTLLDEDEHITIDFDSNLFKEQ